MKCGEFEMILSPVKKNIGIYYKSDTLFGMSSDHGYHIIRFPSRRELEIEVVGIDDV
jgi:hypothetical protein